MPNNNASNQRFTNSADGFSLGGGVTPRTLTLSAGDVAIAGAGSAVITFPSTTSTLATTSQLEFVRLGETVLGSAGSFVSVTGITTGYRYLKVVLNVKVIGSATATQYHTFRMNNISSAVYGSEYNYSASTSVSANRITDSTAAQVTDTNNWLENTQNGLLTGEIVMNQTSREVASGIWYVSATGSMGLARWTGSQVSTKDFAAFNFGLKQTATFNVTRFDIINSAGNSLYDTGSTVTVYGML